MPGSTCCRQAEPAPTCCRRAVPGSTCCRGFYRRPLAAINWSGQGLRGSAPLRLPLGEAPLRFALPQTPTEVCPAGRADCHLLPVGRADGHLLPRILSTTVGRHRLKRPRSAVGRADYHLLPPVLSTTVGRHKLKRPRSARVNPAARAAGTSPFREGVSHRVQGSPARGAVAEGDGGVS